MKIIDPKDDWLLSEAFKEAYGYYLEIISPSLESRRSPKLSIIKSVSQDDIQFTDSDKIPVIGLYRGKLTINRDFFVSLREVETDDRTDLHKVFFAFKLACFSHANEREIMVEDSAKFDNKIENLYKCQYALGTALFAVALYTGFREKMHWPDITNYPIYVLGAASVLLTFYIHNQENKTAITFDQTTQFMADKLIFETCGAESARAIIIREVEAGYGSKSRIADLTKWEQALE